MALHYFHCTDGVDVIVDRRGRETGSHHDLRHRARSVAQELMTSLPTYQEWERWAVHVYDERGEVDVVPFTGSPFPVRVIERVPVGLR